MKKTLTLVLCLIYILFLVSCSFISEQKKEFTFNLSCTPNETNDMVLYFISYDENGETNTDTSEIGTIKNNAISFSKKIPDSSKYVQFMIAKQHSSYLYCYGTQFIDSSVSYTYDFAGAWYYYYEDYEIKPDTNHQMVGINKDYFVDAKLPLSDSFYYNINDKSSYLFYSFKITTKENSCLKVSYSNNENSQLIISKNIEDFFGKQINAYSYNTISEKESDSEIINTDGSPLYLFIRPKHYFDKNETAYIDFTIEDMEDKLSKSASIYSVCAFDSNGFYFIKDPENYKALYYYEYSSQNITKLAKYIKPIQTTEWINDKLYIVVDSYIYLFDLSTKTNSVLYSGTKMINDILLIDNNSKLLVAESEGDWKLFNITDLETPILSSSARTDFYSVNQNYNMIYFPNSKRLVWNEYSINSGLFDSDFSAFTIDINNFENSNQYFKKIFRYGCGNEEKVISSTGYIFNCNDGTFEQELLTNFTDILLLDTCWFSLNNKGEIEKRTYDTPDTVSVSRNFERENLIALTKNENGNLIIVSNGSMLSNKQREIFVHELDTDLKDISTKQINLQKSQIPCDFSDFN